MKTVLVADIWKNAMIVVIYQMKINKSNWKKNDKWISLLNVPVKMLGRNDKAQRFGRAVSVYTKHKVWLVYSFFSYSAGQQEMYVLWYVWGDVCLQSKLYAWIMKYFVFKK